MRIRIRLYLDPTFHIDVDPNPIPHQRDATQRSLVTKLSKELPRLPNFDFDPDPVFDIYADSDDEKILDPLLLYARS